jgi:hypothetical protein
MKGWNRWGLRTPAVPLQDPPGRAASLALAHEAEDENEIERLLAIWPEGA